MNADLPDDDVSIRFYDSDYPGSSLENFDPTLVELGLVRQAATQPCYDPSIERVV